ncbi:MAG TPA: hypothetical protein VGO86_03345 [Candidatus Dormibacteraeota bacterium]
MRVHLGARDYDPGLGRFVSADPVIDHGDRRGPSARCWVELRPDRARAGLPGPRERLNAGSPTARWPFKLMDE